MLCSPLACGADYDVPATARVVTTQEPLYLSYKKGPGSEAEARSYTEANGQESNLADFKASRCFEEGAGIEFLNYLDLGLGRRVSFAECSQGEVLRISACVENGGTPGQNAEAAFHALTGESAVAVCMDYLPSRPAGFETQFYIYGPDGPLLSLEFDRQGPKFLPFACTACHGGYYRPEERQVENAFLLPMLLESLLFAAPPDQEELRAVNALVYQASESPVPSTSDAPGIRQLLDAAYPSISSTPGVFTPGASYQKNQVPPSWQGELELYGGLIRPYCATCHAAQVSGETPLHSPDDVVALKERIRSLVCLTKEMPNALETRKAFDDPSNTTTAQHLAGCN